MKRIQGLDSLRFVMAFIVLLGHGTLPNIDLSFLGNGINMVFNALLNNSTVGVAAVMAFFILSGFVIHYPYFEGKPLTIPSFYVKRLVRIAAPALIAYLIYTEIFSYSMGVIWSLICEAIYYILYPLIYRNIKKLNLIILLSFVISFGVSIFYTLNSEVYNGDFHRNGYYLTWIVGLPVWLLGVKLAEDYKKFSTKKATGFQRLILIRLLVFVVSIICSISRFHLGISYVYTLPLFSFLVYYWVKLEILYYQNKTENKVLVFGGLISYSIYLIHALVIYGIEDYTGINSLTGNVLLCLLAMISSLFFSYIFYIFLEKPTHKLARYLGSKMK